MGWAWSIAAALLLVPATTAADLPASGPPGHVCAAPKPARDIAAAREILKGYGTGGFPIATRSPEAQAYFDNGLQLGHAFAHKSAIAAFEKAEALDPGCAMCAWGEAWARGPTLNYPIDEKAQAELAALADKAAALAKDPRERRLIAALQQRYRRGGGAGPGDYAYARAMDAIARDDPADTEVAVLAADAWMIPAAHKDSRETLPRALELLEGALARNPNDTGAIHFYIHATEMNGEAGRALPYAERLQALAPAASHLVHMPSHTYYAVGRYAQAAASNVDASRIDQANAARDGLAADGVWGLTYHAHNVVFGVSAALMDGDGAAGLELARPVLARKLADQAQAAWITGKAYVALARYAPPAEMLATPEPGSRYPMLEALWRYGRGEAQARLGDAAAIRAEAAQIGRLAPAGARPKDRARYDVPRLVLEGRAAMLEQRYAWAARAYAQAADLQEAELGKQGDPPLWWFPVRRSLAAAKLAQGDAAGARREAMAALAYRPNDGLALTVAARADQAIGDAAKARAEAVQARAAWTGDPARAPLALI